MEVTYRIENLEEILEHLLANQHRHMFILEALLVKAGFTKGELLDLFKEADLDRNRQRLDHTFSEEGEK